MKYLKHGSILVVVFLSVESLPGLADKDPLAKTPGEGSPPTAGAPSRPVAAPPFRVVEVTAVQRVDDSLGIIPGFTRTPAEESGGATTAQARGSAVGDDHTQRPALLVGPADSGASTSTTPTPQGPPPLYQEVAGASASSSHAPQSAEDDTLQMLDDPARIADIDMALALALQAEEQAAEAPRIAQEAVDRQEEVREARQGNAHDETKYREGIEGVG